MRTISLTAVFATLLYSAVLIADDAAEHRKLVEASTSKDRGLLHVVFTETIRSKQQGDWKESYGATVEVLKEGKSVGKFRGSTLPNFLPGKGKPKDWKYSVVQATCAFEEDLKGRYYTWTRTRRADGTRPCLRLSDKVPTVAVSSARASEMSLAELIGIFKDESKAKRYLRFADHILVHSGDKQGWRGSAGCLTIHPDDQHAFFELITEGVVGTLELNRGIEDSASKSSYCY